MACDVGSLPVSSLTRLARLFRLSELTLNQEVLTGIRTSALSHDGNGFRLLPFDVNSDSWQ
jgi:hypothetical protein